MLGRLEEIHHAQEEDIVFKVLTNPIEISRLRTDGYVVCSVQRWSSVSDSSGRRRPIPVEGSEFVLMWMV